MTGVRHHKLSGEKLAKKSRYYEPALFCISGIGQAPLVRAAERLPAVLWLSAANILKCSGFVVLNAQK